MAKKRLACLVMAAVMTIGLLPVTAFAAPGNFAWKNYAGPGPGSFDYYHYWLSTDGYFVYPDFDNSVVYLVGYCGGKTHITIPSTLTFTVTQFEEIWTKDLQGIDRFYDWKPYDTTMSFAVDGFSSGMGLSDHDYNDLPFYFRGVTSVTIPDWLTVIDYFPFLDLPSLTIPATVREIRLTAFAGMQNLTSITFQGNNVLMIEYDVDPFNSLKEVVFESPVPPIRSNSINEFHGVFGGYSDGWFDEEHPRPIAVVPEGSLQAYIDADDGKPGDSYYFGLDLNAGNEPKPVVYDRRGDDITNDNGPFDYKSEDIDIWCFGVENNESNPIKNLVLDVIPSDPAVVTIASKVLSSGGGNEYMYFAFLSAAPGIANLDITMSGTDSEGKPWNYQTSKTIVVDIKDSDDDNKNDLSQHPLPVEDFLLNQIIKNASLFELLANIANGAPLLDTLVAETNYLLRDFSQLDPKVLAMGTGVLALPVIIPALGGSAIAAILSRVAISIVLCPVDMKILDSDGNLLATVKTGDADYIEVNGLLAWADGDKKYFIVPRDKMSEFQFQLEATDDGTMTFASFCTDSDLNLDNMAVFVDVPLTKGGLFEAELADGGVSRLFALENGGRASEIKADNVISRDNDNGSPAMIIILSTLALILIISGGIWFVVRKKKR